MLSKQHLSLGSKVPDEHLEKSSNNCFRWQLYNGVYILCLEENVIRYDVGGEPSYHLREVKHKRVLSEQEKASLLEVFYV